MTTNVPPSRDPANDDTLTGYTKELRRFLFKNIDKALPAMVLSHDRVNNSVRVRPLITMVDSEGATVRREPIPNVPVLNLGGGGFFINFNLPPGQQGMIFGFDRDMSLFLQSQAESRPNTERMHSFSDSIFIPQQWFDYVIAGEDSAAMVIQNLDGSVKIALDDNQIRVVNGATRFELNNGSVTATAPSGFSFNGLTIDGTGALVSPVSVTAPLVNGTTNVTFAGIGGVNHRHSQGNDADGDVQQNVGAPVNG